jgi:hypothetical protein
MEWSRLGSMTFSPTESNSLVGTAAMFHSNKSGGC